MTATHRWASGFFQSQVQAINGQFVGPDGVTPATHTIGDILIIANLLNGGAQVNLQVFKWVGGSNPLQLLANDVGAKCGTNTDPNVCAISNDNSETAPWSYTPKSGTPGVFPTFSFIEGGINVSALLGGQGACFSSFMAETRSSQSQSATLKDFALGQFNTCKMDITKDCPTVSFDPSTNLLTYTYNVTVTNSGFGTVFDLVVTDTPQGQPSTQFSLDSLATGASHTFTGTFTQTPSPSMPNPPTNTATAVAAASDGGQQSVTAGPATAQCQHVDFDSSLMVTKSCTSRVVVENNRVVVAVDVQGSVCNIAPDPSTGDFPEPIDNVVVTDDPAITPINLGTLLTGQCKDYTSTYFPSTVIGNGLPHDQNYSDTVTAAGTGRITQSSRANTASANCPLCP